jgi:hypothetical protein
MKIVEKIINPDLVLEEKIGYFDEEEAVAQLLRDNILFLNTREYKGTMPVIDEAGGRTMVIFMNCNDVFGPCADADDITLEEVPALYKEIIKYPKSGSIRWICFKRNLKPWSKRVKWMKEIGEWDNKMEALPDNKM